MRVWPARYTSPLRAQAVGRQGREEGGNFIQHTRCAWSTRLQNLLCSAVNSCSVAFQVRYHYVGLCGYVLHKVGCCVLCVVYIACVLCCTSE